MNDLQVYGFENREVRVVMKDGEPWFVAKDVAEALGYAESTYSNVEKMTGHVPEKWKGRYPIPTPGGIQEMLCLSEQGLYFFLGRSDKTTALPFQEWYAGEVLPAIRKTGIYALPGAEVALLSTIENYVIAAVDKAFKKQAALPDPKAEAYCELGQFVKKYLLITGVQKHETLIETAYDKYRSFATVILPEKEFMYKIAIEYPDIQIKQRRSANFFCGCLFQYGEAFNA
jgi:prophage antirepressor-like protein